MIYVGIDPGMSGGLAAIDKNGAPLLVTAFKPNEGEFDAYQLCDLITDLRTQLPNSNAVIVAVEKVHSMPKQGVASTFKFGKGYGQILGVLAAKQISFQLITPQEWTKTMLAGEPKENGKNRARVVAQRLFPELSLKATLRSSIVHSGMADAILIAEFLRRKTGRA